MPKVVAVTTKVILAAVLLTVVDTFSGYFGLCAPPRSRDGVRQSRNESQMNYQYEFVTIQFDLGNSGNAAPTENYRPIIQARADLGWRFVEAIPAEVTSFGRPLSMDLVFERPAVGQV